MPIERCWQWLCGFDLQKGYVDRPGNMQLGHVPFEKLSSAGERLTKLNAAFQFSLAALWQIPCKPEKYIVHNVTGRQSDIGTTGTTHNDAMGQVPERAQVEPTVDRAPVHHDTMSLHHQKTCRRAATSIK